MEGGLSFAQEHEILERTEFQTDAFLKNLHGKAFRQLGSSGGGNHFVEFGELELFEENSFNVPAGQYVALLSHSGSRGLGTEIARRYSEIAREQCRLPREAGHFAWLDMDSDAGQLYWMSMNLAGDYAKACHERIHINLAKALGVKPLKTIGNHHNFAWNETLNNGCKAIVHRKGATPAHLGEPGIIPGSMTTPGYLVQGRGVPESLFSVSHGAGRAMSRQKAKESFTQSSLKKMLTAAGVQLIDGSVEEAPLAYKNIDRVMDFQKELVDIQGKFMPRIVRMNKE
jgi:tRNA-splicing ligase RtcB